MSGTVNIRGGIPVTREIVTAAATVEEWHWADAADLQRDDGQPANGRSNWIEVEVTGASQIKFFWSATAAAADQGIEVGIGEKWSGPVECARFYTNSPLASAFRVTATLRVGG